jgi:diguanylate cyclase (GGDEF)-like protein/PAS domain S-box-containing protein
VSRLHEFAPSRDRGVAHRSRLAGFGVVAILLGVSGFAVWSSHLTAAAAHGATTANQLSDDYARADSAVAAEESLERKYRLEPGSANRANYDAAATSFVTALTAINANGDADMHALVAKLTVQQASYLASIKRMFAAVDAGDTATVLKIDSGEVDPAFGAIETEVATQAAAEHTIALNQLRHLQRIETLTSKLTPAVFGLGLLLAGLLASVTRVYRRVLLVERARAVEHSLHDPLTGLPNRGLLAERFERALRAATQNGTTIALLLIDLDRFKEVNDTFGHKYGDQLLRQIGHRFAAVVREDDTVARIGGDEFAILVPNVTVAVATGIARSLLHALGPSFEVEGVDLEVDASIGVVVSGEHGADAETLLQHADVAMYVAKRRNIGVFAYNPDIDGYSPERLALLGDLRRALELHELVLHYQPKVSVSTGEVVGAEALVRWQHPTHGLLFPDAFIPTAEHTGLIGPLTSYILDAALAQAKIWADAGRPLLVSVNLSGRNLLDEQLPDEVAGLLVAHGVSASLLELEVTESAIVLDPVRARRSLERLSDLGVRLSIDDFGAGYTSLGQLKTLPVDELKIDRSFVMTMTTDARDALIVHSVIELGQNLGLSIVAEGVETAEALSTLRGFGCDIAQGYYLARPAPVETFDAWRLARKDGEPMRATRLATSISPEVALRASEERFRTLFTHAPIGVIEALADGTLVAVNPEICAMLGYREDELIGHPVSMITDPSDQAQQAQEMAALSVSSNGYISQRRYRRKDGSAIPVVVSVGVVRQLSGAVHRMVGMAIDISELAGARQEIDAAHAEMAERQTFTDALLASAGAGIVACDSTGQLTLMNQTARRWHGLDPDIEPSRDQLAQLAVDLFEADGVTPLAFATSPLMRALRHGRVWNSELVIVPANMPSTRVMVTGTALLGPAGEVVGAVATMHDLTLLKQRETELQEALTDIVNVEQRLADAALRDPLTGLPNRTLLADRLASTLSRTGRSGHQMAVLFCDLDGFKAVNTNGGHAAGDAMLQACAQRLLATLRAEDTAARVGGDEFVVVLEPSSRGWAGPDGAPIDVRSYALVVAERIEEALAEPVDFNGNRYAVTVSIGLTFAQAGDDVEEVLAQADRAMYEAKSLGKNRHQFYTDVRRVRAL